MISLEDLFQKKKTTRIKIWGIVQGVGFRPFVAKLADSYKMQGEVLNIGGLVEISVTDTVPRIQKFIDALQTEKPAPAEIVHMKIDEVEDKTFQGFKILDSDVGADDAAMIPADLSLCDDCLAELIDSSNPRHRHPFISCMVCGPRYTIIDRFPYDRENTTMDQFPMCEFCNNEYTNRIHRRYHAQTVSCHNCGPMLLEETGVLKTPLDSAGIQSFEQVLLNAVNHLKNGKIIGLKSVGGYNFVCSPFSERTVNYLRQLKIREEKPFAVMFRDLEQVCQYCYVSKEEEKLLQSSSRPIVLLERKKQYKLRSDDNNQDCDALDMEANQISQEVYKTSRYIGAFLPSMGLQYLLIDACGPLILTSANLSDVPMIKDDEEMLHLFRKTLESAELKNEFAGIYYNNRKIRIRVDDSVVRVIDGQPQMIRRSKGYAPVPLYINSKLTKEKMIFATGGQLKACFSLSKGPFAYVSQYFGDLDSKEIRDIYNENVARMSTLFRIKPTLIVCDLHPLYETTKMAEEYAQKNDIPLLKVQHHHAHIASVMAEHNLRSPVIGVSFDGTGYGSDGAIWGGEFLIASSYRFERLAHLEYIKMLGGDSSMKEGWKSAYCYEYHYQLNQIDKPVKEEPEWDSNGKVPVTHKRKKDGKRQLVEAGLDHNINTIQSSSMGRLFDGVAAFAGIHQENRYEGECAIMLENFAAEALDLGLTPWKMEFTIGKGSPLIISAETIFQRIDEARLLGVDQRQIALGFHEAVSAMILIVCQMIRKEQGVEDVALSGGVFQNKIIMEQSLQLLRRDGFKVYYNISVPPNDGGICLGQTYVGMNYLIENMKE